ncbi:hypothetical protein B0H19DRAFT_1070536 [Mycena capillaripes]|nr:hypothetical protein B0H19DRAFT_1070536 [Mycena capillaripes]
MEVAYPVHVAPIPAVETKCNACRNAPITPGYVTCRPCRDKRNEKQRQSNALKRQELHSQFLKAGMKANIPVPPPGESNSAEKQKKKRKMPIDGHGENEADALERIRKRFKTLEPFAKPNVAARTPSADTSDVVFDKYVVASELHKAIKRRYPDNTTSLRFYGTYAIIALPDVDNKQRARQVARDLRDNTSLHFNLEDRKSHRGDVANAYTIKYNCTCRASMKRTASDLATYFASKNKTMADETPKSECRGRIEISAEDDRSHPLGWLGQRVKVTIIHPKKI